MPNSSVSGRMLSPVFNFLLSLLLLSFTATSLPAKDYLKLSHLDGVALLPPPPPPGSEEESADLAAVRAAFQKRTPAEETRAIKDSTLAFSLFAPAIGPVFVPGKLPLTEALLQKIKKEIGEPIDECKDHFKRRRPYQLDEKLTLGQPEPSFAYPSGHSTRGTVYALVLAEIFPAKKDAILTVGRDIGWDRVLIGKHFPSDVYAGRVLGQAIVREMMSHHAFQRDLAAAKAEAAAALLALEKGRVSPSAEPNLPAHAAR